MTVTLQSNRPTHDTMRDAEIIALGNDGGDFTLFVRQPSYADQLADMDTPGKGSWALRIESTVYGWDGVVDETGKPVPYTHQNLAAMITANPITMTQIMGIVMRRFMGMDDDDTKESNGASGTLSAPDAPESPVAADASPTNT